MPLGFGGGMGIRLNSNCVTPSPEVVIDGLAEAAANVEDRNLSWDPPEGSGSVALQPRSVSRFRRQWLQAFPCAGSSRIPIRIERLEFGIGEIGGESNMAAPAAAKE